MTTGMDNTTDGQAHPTFSKSYGAFLFDMDGTLISSVAAAERIWGAWATKHGLDVASFLPTMHGVRAVETIAKQRLENIDVLAEAERITQAEMDDVDGVFPIDGVIEFLRQIPPDKWAIVTSASPPLAKRRLEITGITPPKIVITAADVENGKPDPACFLLAARKLGVEPANCLVFEDAVAGIAAGEAAGADVMVISATHTHPLVSAHATVHDYTNITVIEDETGRLRLKSKMQD